MKALQQNIIIALVATILADAFLVGVFIFLPRNSVSANLFQGLVVALLLVSINYPIIKSIPAWRIIFSENIRFFSKISTEVPATWSSPIDLTCLEKGLLVVFFKNCSPECIKLKIMFQAGNADIPETIAECGEPEPLGWKNGNRRRAHWLKGTGMGRHPLIYEWPTGKTAQSKGVLKVVLDWNFIGSSLEHRLPKDRIADGEIFVFARREWEVGNKSLEPTSF